MASKASFPGFMIPSVILWSLFAWVAWPPSAFPQSGLGSATPRMTDAQIIEDLGSRLERLVKQDRFSGVVLIAKNGKILFEQAYGYADHAFAVPNNAQTKFNLGSMGKMFTAVSVLQLAQAGKLSLNDTLIKVVPDYPDKDIASKVTIHQMLTHTSGLGDMFGERFQNMPKDKLRTIDSHLPLFTGKPLLFEPGTEWSYSNAGFIVLGLVIEHVSGRSYYDYVREHVFKPAGMTNTDNYPIDADVSDLALGYTSMGQPPGAPRRSNIFSLQRGASAGGGFSNVEDLLRFAEALEGHKLLNREYTKLLMTGKVTENRRGTTKYAYGMEEDFVNGVRIVGHRGGGPGISGSLDIYPDLGYTVAVMTNYDQAASLVNPRLRSQLTGQALPEATHVSLDLLEGYVGKYSADAPPGAPGGGILPLLISSDQEGLWLDLPMGGSHRLLPLSATEFFDEDNVAARYRFSKDEKGQFTMEVTGAGVAFLKATKVP